MLRTIWLWLITVALTVLLLGACDQRMDTLDASFNPERPFGIDWQISEEEIAGLKVRSKKDCAQRPTRHYGATYDVFGCSLLATELPQSEIPGDLWPGNIRLYLDEESRPEKITYRFIYSTPLGMNIEGKQRTDEIRKTLDLVTKRVFGQPETSIDFTVSIFTVSPDDRETPCHTWLKGKIVISYCDDQIDEDWVRVGIAFMHVDRYQMGIEDYEALSPDPANDSVLSKPYAETLEELRNRREETAQAFQERLDLAAGLTVETCQNEDLQPLSTILSEHSLSSIPGLSEAVTTMAPGELHDYAIASYYENPLELDDATKSILTLHAMNAAAEAGNPDALFEMGRAVAFCSLSASQDMEAAADWWRRAAKAGNVHAMHRLAMLQLATDDSDEARIEALQLLQTCRPHRSGCRTELRMVNSWLEVMAESSAMPLK